MYYVSIKVNSSLITLGLGLKENTVQSETVRSGC